MNHCFKIKHDRNREDKVKLRLPGNKGGYDLEGEDSLETGLRLTGRLVRSWSRGQGRVRSGF